MANVRPPIFDTTPAVRPGASRGGGLGFPIWTGFFLAIGLWVVLPTVHIFVNWPANVHIHIDAAYARNFFIQLFTLMLSVCIATLVSIKIPVQPLRGIALGYVLGGVLAFLGWVGYLAPSTHVHHF